MDRRKKTPSFNSLAAQNDEVLTTSCDIDHAARITRLGALKQRSKHQEQFLFQVTDLLAAYDNKPSKQETILALSYANRLMSCGNFLLFKNYYTVGETKLAKVQTCQVHLLCPLCAAVRASKAAKRYSERVHYVLEEKTSLKPVFITLTVKNGPDLSERKKHITDAFRYLMDRRRDSLKKNRGRIEFSKIHGAVFSYEVTKNQKTGEWHPHVHMFALVESWIDRDRLVQEWQEATLDSHIVDVRRVKKDPVYGYGKAFAEVCKYALKFSDMSLGDTWTAFKALKGQRLSGSIGSLYGVKIPEDATDEPLTNDELPYLELFYRFKNNAGYDLALTRHVHAQASVVSEERSGVCVRGDETQHAPHCTTTSGAADATGERGGGGTTDHEADSADTATAHDVHWQRYADNYGQAALVVALIPDFEDT